MILPKNEAFALGPFLESRASFIYIVCWILGRVRGDADALQGPLVPGCFG